MTLTEIQSKKAAARAKMEDLLGRIGTRQPSDEEKQLQANLLAEGVECNSLIARYETLASFDGTTNNQTIIPLARDTKKATADAFEHLMRTGKQAADVPIQIVDSPTHGAIFTVPQTIMQGTDNFPALDTPVALGATVIAIDTTRTVIYPLGTDVASSSQWSETTRPTESKPFALNHLTLEPVEWSDLEKISLRSISDPAVNITERLLRSLGNRLIRSQANKFVADMETSLHANTHCHVGAGTDRYASVTKLLASISQSFRSASNKFAGSQTTLQQILNERGDTGFPLFEYDDGKILGRDFVIADSLTDGFLYFGDWATGAVAVRTPLGIQRLIELYATQGCVGYLGLQSSDWGFYADLTTIVDQPVKYCQVGADLGS